MIQSIMVKKTTNWFYSWGLSCSAYTTFSGYRL